MPINGVARLSLFRTSNLSEPAIFFPGPFEPSCEAMYRLKEFKGDEPQPERHDASKAVENRIPKILDCITADPLKDWLPKRREVYLATATSCKQRHLGRKQTRGSRHGICRLTAHRQASAMTGTVFQYSCRPTSAPVLNRFYLSIVLSCPLLSSSIYLWGTTRGPIPHRDRIPPFVRNFRLLTPALRVRLFHGRLDG